MSGGGRGSIRRRAGKITLVVAVLLLAGCGGIFLMRDTVGGVLLPLALRFLAPSHGFDLAYKAQPPDYAESRSWLARPETQDRADYVPAGPALDVATRPYAPSRDTRKPVDVFFVHPTTYLRGDDWNDPLASGTSTEENTEWTLVNQASAFNGCCNVYAPRYRQTSILFLGAPREIATQALDLAYSDVERAFDHFVAHLNEGRPFILAGHSQGTIHLRRLLRERITGTPLAQRMLAAYLIGGGVLLEELARMHDLHACQNATDLHCVIHWETYGPNPRPVSLEEGTTLCTNPLSWTTDEHPAPASANLGAVPTSGHFHLQFRGADIAQGVVFEPLSSPIPAYTGARCKDGVLIVEDQTAKPFGDYGILPGQNYHALDYPLFYTNIRANATERVSAYVAAHDAAQAGKTASALDSRASR
jgi:hypothetical protein